MLPHHQFSDSWEGGREFWFYWAHLEIHLIGIQWELDHLDTLRFGGCNTRPHISHNQWLRAGTLAFQPRSGQLPFTAERSDSGT